MLWRVMSLRTVTCYLLLSFSSPKLQVRLSLQLIRRDMVRKKRWSTLKRLIWWSSRSWAGRFPRKIVDVLSTDWSFLLIFSWTKREAVLAHLEYWLNLIIRSFLRMTLSWCKTVSNNKEVKIGLDPHLASLVALQATVCQAYSPNLLD